MEASEWSPAPWVRVAAAWILLGCSPASAPRPTQVPPVSTRTPDPAFHPQRLAMTRGGACVVRGTGRVACWGPAWGGAAHDIEGVRDVEELVASSPGVCARLATGGVTCWSPRHERFSIDVHDAVDLENADGEICAVRRSGNVSCWGGYFGAYPWRPSYGPDPLPAPEERVDEEIMEERAGHDYEGLSDEVFMQEEDPELPWFGTAIWRHVVHRRDVEDAVALAGGAGAWCVLRRAGRVRCWGELAVPNTEPREPEDAFDLSVTGALDLTIVDRPSGVCVTLADRGAVCSHLETVGGVVDPTPEGGAAIPPDWIRVPGAARVQHFLPRAPTLESICWREGEAPTCFGPDAEEPTSFWETLGWNYETEGELPDPFVDPVPVELGIGGSHLACARYAEGPVRCWGGPDMDLGEGEPGPSSTPEPVPGTD